MYSILDSEAASANSTPASPSPAKKTPTPKPVPKARRYAKSCKLAPEQVVLLFLRNKDNDPNGRRSISVVQYFQVAAEPTCGSDQVKVTFNVTGKKGDAQRRLVVACMATSTADRKRVDCFFEAICKVACGNALTKPASAARAARAAVLKQFLQSTEEKPQLARAKFALIVQKKWATTWLEEKDGARVKVQIRLREVSKEERNGTATHVLEYHSTSDKAAKAARKWFYALVKNPNAKLFVERTSGASSAASSAAATPRVQQRRKPKPQLKPELESVKAFPTLDGAAPAEATAPVWNGKVNSAAEKAAKLEAEAKAALAAAAEAKAAAERQAAEAAMAARAAAAVKAGKDAKAERQAKIAAAAKAKAEAEAAAEAEAQAKLLKDTGKKKLSLKELKLKNARARKMKRTQDQQQRRTEVEATMAAMAEATD